MHDAVVVAGRPLVAADGGLGDDAMDARGAFGGTLSGGDGHDILADARRAPTGSTAVRRPTSSTLGAPGPDRVACGRGRWDEVTRPHRADELAADCEYARVGERHMTYRFEPHPRSPTPGVIAFRFECPRNGDGSIAALGGTVLVRRAGRRGVLGRGTVPTVLRQPCLRLESGFVDVPVPLNGAGLRLAARRTAVKLTIELVATAPLPGARWTLRTRLPTAP